MALLERGVGVGEVRAEMATATLLSRERRAPDQPRQRVLVGGEARKPCPLADDAAVGPKRIADARIHRRGSARRGRAGRLRWRHGRGSRLSSTAAEDKAF